MSATSFLEIGNKRIAYHLSEGALPCVIFMGGFNSNMNGLKATSLEDFCLKRGQRFVRFDYTGHGQSSGRFEEGTIGGWKQDALDTLDQLGSADNILVGSSMGAWLALLVALERKEKISALVGISSAPDFTERMIWDVIDADQRQQLQEKGVFYAPSCYGEDPYPITKKLIEEGRNHLLLDGKIPLDIPVRLLHGTHDEDVPWKFATSLKAALTGNDVTLQMIENGNHRLSDPPHLSLLCGTVEKLLVAA